MGTQQGAGKWRQQELGLEAVETRLQALQEYLAVYRASFASSGSADSHARVRVLRRDVSRLRAWGWYLMARRDGAGWLPAVQWLARVFSVFMVPQRHRSRRHQRSRAMRHLSSYSLIERAYAAQEDDIQGRLLTLRLAQRQNPNDLRAREIKRLEREVDEVVLLRLAGLPEARQLTVICHLLTWTMGLRSCLGLRLPLADVADR